ncbi:MAG TPA: DivIVA domain-containing protein [Acidimicrobiia bacterium]|nr:DivIVA domain-containing protein [Acidimicrobiia bacterium]
MSIREQGPPDFSHSRRGYDPAQVDDYVAQLREYAIQAEERAASAELALGQCQRELASPGSGGISQRLAGILDLANEEADAIRARATSEAEAMHDAAVAEAADIVSDANDQRDAAQRETDALTAAHSELLQRLLDLGNDLGAATARYTAVASAPQAVELFDGEAGEQPVEDAVAGEEQPEAAPAHEEPEIGPVDPEAETQLITQSTPTPEP